MIIIRPACGTSQARRLATRSALTACRSESPVCAAAANPDLIWLSTATAGFQVRALVGLWLHLPQQLAASPDRARLNTHGVISAARRHRSPLLAGERKTHARGDLFRFW